MHEKVRHQSLPHPFTSQLVRRIDCGCMPSCMQKSKAAELRPCIYDLVRRINIYIQQMLRPARETLNKKSGSWVYTHPARKLRSFPTSIKIRCTRVPPRSFVHSRQRKLHSGARVHTPTSTSRSSARAERPNVHDCPALPCPAFLCTAEYDLHATRQRSVPPRHES